MYTFVDFTSQIVGRRGVPCPTNKGVSYTNLVCWLGRDLKNRLLLLYYYIIFIKHIPVIFSINSYFSNIGFFPFNFLLYHIRIYIHIR
jgi:hypothetical protein